MDTTASVLLVALCILVAGVEVYLVSGMRHLRRALGELQRAQGPVTPPSGSDAGTNRTP